MPEPRFLKLEHVVRIHDTALAVTGGLRGVINEGALESAIAMPQTLHAYESSDLFDLAAAYAFYIAKAHAFADGNKRAGLGAATVFLNGNGIRIDEHHADLSEVMCNLVTGSTSRRGLAHILRSAAIPSGA